MCGLVGILSKSKSGFFYKDKTIFLQMLISDMFRGLDSTGCFSVNRFGNLKMIKDASPASYFINKKETRGFFDKMISESHVMIGHNRKATMGVVEDKNAHPFIEGNVCLVHNGTLTNHYKLADRTVDSNAVAAHINEHGYKSMLKQIEGAYALIWYNAAEKMVYFCRNAERPLHLVETTDKIYLASEPKMLDWILDRNDISKYTIQLVPTDKVFKFNLETRKLECETKPKKESVPRVIQNHSQHKTLQRTSACGNPVLVHSSEPSSQVNKATIETYKSGQEISWKILNYEFKARSTTLEGESMDGFQTKVTCTLDNTRWSKKVVEDLVRTEYVSGKIGSISSKKGFVQLYLKSVDYDVEYISKNNISVERGRLAEVGSCCFQCGTLVDTKQDIAKSEITTNSNGDIMYISCELCNDSYPYNYGNRMC